MVGIGLDMFTYVFANNVHRNTDIAYMRNLGMDDEAIEAVHNQKQFEIERAKNGVRSECEKRITKHWSAIGQVNVALGIYSEEEAQACKDCINAHRQACNALLERSDLLELNYTSDEYWPVL